MLRFVLLVALVVCGACSSSEGPSDGGCTTSATTSASVSTTTTGPHPCLDLADCAALDPGVCGTLACDESGLVGVPVVPGVPAGCYVRISPVCETPANIGGPCMVDTDCLALKCYTSACVAGTCEYPEESAGIPCGILSVCNGAGQCCAVDPDGGASCG